MRIILIRSRAIDQAVHKIALSLSNSGHDVTLLVWDRQNDLISDPNIPYKVSTFKLHAPYDRYIACIYLPLWWFYELMFLLYNNSDIIHACDLDTLMPAILAKSMKRSKLCYIIYDFYANNINFNLVLNIGSYIRKIIANIELYCIGFVDILFLVDECRYEEVKDAKFIRIEYIYNSPPDHILSEEQQYLNNDGKFIIFYAGVISESRGLNHIISAIKGITYIELILAGSSSFAPSLEILIKESPNTKYIGYISYEDVLNYTIESDILFRFSDPQLFETAHASPNKLFEAMMCGKPIIVSDGSSMANIVRKENCGLVVPYGDVQAIKDAVLKLKKDINLRQKLGQNGRKAYEGKYAWTIMEKRLKDAYSDLAEFGKKIKDPYN